MSVHARIIYLNDIMEDYINKEFNAMLYTYIPSQHVSYKLR